MGILRRNLNATTIIAVVALVFAMAGGAWAAGKYIITSKSQIKPSVLKQLKGAKGAKGAPGAPGATGPAGAKGDTGATGTNGTNGTDGTDGVNGKNVVIGAPTGAECESGGATVQIEGEPTTKKAVCNGQSGFTSTLPTGKTETGTWGGVFSEGPVIEPISFPIPLEEAPDPVFVGPSAEEREDGEDEGCLGLESNGTPTAEPGKLCVYLQENLGSGLTTTALFLDPTAPSQFAEGAAPSGTAVSVECTANPCLALGVWAVTAE